MVIANARPLDLDLRASMKACFNAAAALEPGGLFITLSAAPDRLGDLRLPRRLPRWVGALIKSAPRSLLDPIVRLANRSPDQAAGGVSLLSVLRLARAWLYYTPAIDGLEPLGALGLEFFSDLDALFARARELKPRAEAVVLPAAGASYIAWD